MIMKLGRAMLAGLALSLPAAGLARSAAPDPAAAAAEPAVAAPLATVLPPPAVSAPATAAPVEKMVCKRQEVIGSLIQKKRVCMTERNWVLHEKNAQDELQELTKPGAFSPN